MERYSKFSKEVKIEACEKYHNGKGSFKSIAKEIGCNQETMIRWYYSYMQQGDSTFTCQFFFISVHTIPPMFCINIRHLLNALTHLIY